MLKNKVNTKIIKNTVERIELTIFAVTEFSTAKRIQHTTKASNEKINKNNLIRLFIISDTP